MARTAIVLAVLTFGGVAHADAEEQQLGMAGVASTWRLGKASAGASTFAVGGALRYAYGVSSDWEANARVSLAGASSVHFAGATIGPNDGHLYADILAGELSVGVRWLAGVDRARLFERTRPLVGLRAGMLLRSSQNQKFLDDDNAPIGDPLGSDLDLHPFAGVELGLQHRVGRALMLAATLDASAGGATYLDLGIHLELGWAWY